MDMSQSFYNDLIKHYLRAPINTSFNPKLSLGNGNSSIEMEVNKAHFHSAQFLHGSVIFKLLDDAAFFAAQSEERTYFLFTASFTSYFIRPVNKGILFAEGSVISHTKSQIISESSIKNDEGKLIAKGSGVFVVSREELGSLTD